jgi:hypothetical protein
MAASRSATRIVLSLECGAAEAPALEAALALAAGLGGELAALFVEDERLLRLAALPFGREIGRTSALLRTLEPEQLEHAFQAEAGRLRRALASAAEPLALKWTLDIARGDTVSVSLERLGPADLLVLSRSVTAGFMQSRRAAGKAQVRRSPGTRPVAVLLTGEDDAMRALDAAFAIARHIAGEVAVLVEAPDENDYRVRREQVRERLGGAVARFVRVSPKAPHAVAEVVRSQGAAALVWPGAARRQREALAEMLDELACPVVLVP